MPHKFSLGQSVSYRNTRSLESNFCILQQMPAAESTTELRYKVKAGREGFARVVLESELMPTNANTDGEAHRVFGGSRK